MSGRYICGVDSSLWGRAGIIQGEFPGDQMMMPYERDETARRHAASKGNENELPRKVIKRSKENAEAGFKGVDGHRPAGKAFGYRGFGNTYFRYAQKRVRKGELKKMCPPNILSR